MRKPGENPERVAHTGESFPVSLWQRYASPVWMDIRTGRTKNLQSSCHRREKRNAPIMKNYLTNKSN